MHGEQDHVLLLARLQKTNTENRTTSKVEGPLRFLRAQTQHFCLALFVRESTQILHCEGQLGRRVDELHWFIGDERDSRAQYFMSPHELAQTPFEHCHLQRTRHAQGGGDVEGMAARLQLIEKPESLLCEREGRHVATRPRLQLRTSRTTPFTLLDTRRQSLRRRRFEQITQSHAEGGAQTRDHARRQQ